MKQLYIIRTLLLIVVAILSAGAVMAQDIKQDRKLSKIVNENRALRDTIRAREIVIERNKSYINELQTLYDSITKQKDKELNLRYDSITAKRIHLEKRRDSLKQACDEAQGVINSLNKELAELRPFRELQLMDNLKRQAPTWASKPFSQLDSGAIRKVLDDCDKYGGNNADIKKIAGELRTLQKDLQLYSAAWGVLTEPFNESGRRAMRRQLDALLSRYEDAPQQGELIALDELLRDYDGYVYIFQDFINRINDDLKDSRRKKSPDQARFALEKSLDNEDQISNMENIRMVPYLKDCLDEYLKALERDPLKHWAGEKEILEMVK